MRIILLTFLAFLGSLNLSAQSGNIVLFTSGGERFYATLNGVRQNQEAETNLKITDLNQEAYKMTIIFEDQSIEPMVDKTLYIHHGYEVVYQLKTNKKGKWVSRMTSEAPLASAPSTGATTVAYHSTPTPTSRPATPVATTTTTGSDVHVSETTTTTTTSTTGGGTGDAVNVGMNVNVGGETMSINMSGMGMGMDATGTETTTTTTTTTSSTTTNGGYASGTTTTAGMDTYGGGTPAPATGAGCFGPMPAGEFAGAKKSVSSKTFSDSKMTIAKQVTKNNCLDAMQIKEIAALFDFESDRLDYAKFAHQYCMDPQNYYKVNDAFEFETTIEELNESIGR